MTRSGAEGFGRDYWDTAYADPEVMEVTGNAEAHVLALRGAFGRIERRPSSVIDLGFGLGVLLDRVVRAFEPYRSAGIEPSAHAFERVRAAGVGGRPEPVALEQVDLGSWCRRPDHPRRRFDLGLCTSVWQYVADEELPGIVDALAERLKWLYLTVPDADTLAQQAEVYGWDDPWAIHRPRTFYADLLRGRFEAVGTHLFESRVRIPEEDSPFSDRLWRA